MSSSPCAPARTCCSARRTRRRWHGWRKGSRRPQRRGLIDADDDAAARRRLDELRRWLGRLRPAAARRRRLWRAPGARRRAGPTLDHPRPRRRRAAAAAAGRRRADRGRPVEAGRPDAGRHVVDGAARRWQRRSAAASRASRRSSCRRCRARPTSPVSASGWRPFDVVVVGTFSAHLQPAQAELAAAVLAAGTPTVTVALRTPWDLLAYPSARTHVCTYGILPPSMEALAGRARRRGAVRRPVARRHRRSASARARAPAEG